MTGRRLGQAAYAALWVIALPVLLTGWAGRLDTWLPLPVPGPSPADLAIALLGGALVAASGFSLWVRGHGLPMSPYPPERLVASGPYRFAADPIYAGAVLLCIGLSLAAGSPGGLWVVSPALAAAAAAFVLGYERDATRRRFGVTVTPLLRLPPDVARTPAVRERVSVYALVLLPWTVLYLAVEFLGVPPGARSAYFAWEAALPVMPWTEAVYVLTYPFVALAPLVARQADALRRFGVAGLWATALIIPLYLLVPLTAVPKPVPGEGFWQTLMEFERRYDQPVTAFPAFHVVWSLLAARVYASALPRLRTAWYALAMAIGVSCVTTGIHAVADVAGGGGAFLLVSRGRAAWRWILDRTEAVANAWREATLGPVRLMSHGIFGALGTMAAFLIAIALAGPGHHWWLAGMALAAIIGAGLWAQAVEGSSQLLRPFGYFGGVFGVLLLGGVAWAARADVWLLLAVTAIGGAFGQAIARIRCLIQGCCHGRRAPAAWGIRHTHPRSRVVWLAGLGGVSLYPTALSSLLWMTFTGLCLLRLWSVGTPLPFIIGAYFMLAGLGRFVEEHYRGEPQTPAIGGLRLYQWLAIAFVAGGAAVTALAPHPLPTPVRFDISSLALAGAVGLVAYLAFGVDLPASRRRFSRLL